MTTAELLGLVVTIVTAVLIKLIDHYLPDLVDQAHRLNNTHLTRRAPVAPDDDLDPELDPELDEHHEEP